MTRRATWRAVVVLATASQALLTLLSAFTPEISSRVHLLERFEPHAFRSAGQALALCGGVALLALLPGLARGHRRSAARTVAVLWTLAVLHAAKGLDWEEAVLALALAGVVRRGVLHGDPDRPPRLVRYGGVALGCLMAAFALELGILLVGGRDVDLGRHVLQTGYAALTSGWSPGSGPLADVVWSLVALALGAGLVVVLALLRPVRADAGHTQGDHREAARIVTVWGTDTLAPFALREDKAYFFGHGGVLPYRTLRETAIVSGDPIGPPHAVPEILEEFAAFAAGNGWDVVLTAASDRFLESYRRLGLHVLRIGSEAVVDPAGFSLEGRPVRKLRQSVTRVERRGWSIEIVPAGDLQLAHVDELLAVERGWRAAEPRLPGFAMAMDRLWGAPEDRRDLYVVARDPEGELRSFLRFVRHGRGLSLDAMRRLEGTPNGLTEACVAALLAYARDTGEAEVSLNFAGFAHLMAADAALGPGQRVARRLLRMAHARFQLERLVDFNAKFSPEWRPRHLVVTSRRRLPLAALRVLQAEGYLRAPATPREAGARAWWRPEPVPLGLTVPELGS